jgi:hypothetical protein
MPQNLAPPVVIHSLTQAETVLRQALPCTLLSARGAALAGGVGWWQALIRHARAAWPAVPCEDVLDCADAPGMAMAALRLEQRILVLDASCPGFAAVARAAMAQGALLLAAPPPSLDLAGRGAVRHLVSHLRNGTQHLVKTPDRDRPGTLR